MVSKVFLMLLTTITFSFNAPKNMPPNYEQINIESSEKIFDFLKNEKIGKLKLSLKNKELEKIIGKPEIKSKFKIWAADGAEHQTWKYKKLGIELDMMKIDKNTSEINMITIKSPCKLKTTKNIGIGSTKDEVLKSYKKYIDQESYSKNSNSIIVGSIYGGIIFGIKNNKVNEIFLGASAE
jgi:hypothetical protein